VQSIDAETVYASVLIAIFQQCSYLYNLNFLRFTVAFHIQDFAKLVIIVDTPTTTTTTTTTLLWTGDMVRKENTL
jgi:hypothetical protein